VAETEAAAMADPSVQKWLEGKTPKKIIVVHHRIINIVV
jgi:leucyl-tRNA synthetase